MQAPGFAPGEVAVNLPKPAPSLSRHHSGQTLPRTRTNCLGQIASVKTAPSAAGMEKHAQLTASLLLTELKSCQQNGSHLSGAKPKCSREVPSATAPQPQSGGGSAGAAPSPEPNVGEGGTEGGGGAGRELQSPPGAPCSPWHGMHRGTLAAHPPVAPASPSPPAAPAVSSH